MRFSLHRCYYLFALCSANKKGHSAPSEDLLHLIVLPTPSPMPSPFKAVALHDSYRLTLLGPVPVGG